MVMTFLMMLSLLPSLVFAAAAPGKCEAIGVTTEGPAEESARVYEDLEKKYGSVDVIISNTGDTGSDKAMEELESEELLEETSHLLGGAFRMMKAALPYIRK